MAALPQRVKLHRRQAMKRKGFSRAGRSSTLSKIIESRPPSDSSGEDADDEDCRGSSLDLTPTLLGIYDKIASANRNEDQPDGGQSNVFKTNENLEDEENNRCHSPPMLPRIEQKSLSQQKVRELYLQSSLSERVDCNKPSKLRMDNTDSTGEIDNKKRPLSISSMSSSSTSSLPRRSKRPNLSEYVASVTSSKLDIEKLDNLLYIDDEQEHEIPEQSADESSECSDEKRKSGDSDSQTSIDHQDRDQSDLQLQESISLHQSDSILSFTPLNSENCSTVDLSLNSDLTSCESGLDRVQRSPSRSSQRSAAVSRSSSQKSGHYVSYVQRVVSELLETERTYVLNLQDIKQGYYEYLKATQPEHLSTEDLICLFGNILQIYNFSCEFLRQLEMCDLEPIKVAECFVTNNKGFEIYAEYCTNYPSAVDVLTRVMRDSGLSDLFKQRQLTMGHGLPLGAYLLKPVQRILKYHLLLQNILKHYNKTDDGYDTLVAAHDHMTDMSHHINEMKRKHEHAVRVQEIQSQLEDYEGEDFTRLGELVLEGSFRMIGVKASRQMFLFEKGVIIAKRKEDGMLSCKAFIPCAMLMLVESIPREPLNFQILPVDNPRGAHIIHARNLEQKRKWCQEIKRLMVESYANKIPDNVKALILERLGKSKDEDALAKSGSTDPGKSHVTTPDYLDKRNRTRRKSGPNLLQAIRKTEILRPQKNKKLPGRSKGEASSPKLDIPESALYPKETSPLINNNTEHYGFRNNMPGPLKAANTSTPKENLENLSPSRKSKRPLSLQRSLSFQNSQRGLPTGNPEAHSMENLVNSDGPKIRNPSFRLATQASPIGFDVSEASLRESPEKSVTVFSPKGILVDQKNANNLPENVRKNLENLEKPECPNEMSPNHQGVFLNTTDNLNGSYLDEGSLRKRGRYGSMPALSSDSPNTRRVSRLYSDRGAGSPVLNQKLPVCHVKRIDGASFFSKINQAASQGLQVEHEGNNLNKDHKRVNAFNDTFTNIRKSQDNLGTKRILTQPKSFTSSLENSAIALNSHAKLNKWGPEKFTKGSMSDLSHLKENPWLPNKLRPYTDSRVTNGSEDNLPVTPKSVSRLSIDTKELRRSRAHSCNSRDSDSSDSLDWIVYANRNSIPLANFGCDEHYRPLSSGSKVLPYNDKIPQSPLVSHSTPLNSGCHGNTRGQGHKSENGDSSISLSGTTSDDTCSSPDILKQVCLESSSSAEKLQPRDRSQVSRSFSSPEGYTKDRHLGQEERSASVDIHPEHIKDSERLLAEMEHYMKLSTSSSGSLSSTNKGFPTVIPNFEDQEQKRHSKNRDSCISTGSNSSYDSTTDLSSEPHQEERIVHTIKSKISNFASKFTGKWLHHSGTGLAESISPGPSSPKAKNDEGSTKLNHHLSLRVKPGGHAKSGEPDLTSLLREMEPGSEAIGSRMANTDLDDYALFAMPKAPMEQQNDTPKSGKQVRKTNYGRFSNYNQIQQKSTEPGNTGITQSELRLNQPMLSLKNIASGQADSAFSIQSADVDESSSDDSPRNDDLNERSDGLRSKSKSETNDLFYERRLSEALNTADPFRDSAVYCDDVIDSPPIQSESKMPLSPKLSIKTVVQQLEEKSKACAQPILKVKQKEPSAIIKQRMQSLAAQSEYRNKSASGSCSISTANSRAHSRCSSRAQSEDRTVTKASLQEYFDNKFPRPSAIPKTEDDSVFLTRSASCEGRMKPAFSMGRLDTLSFDVGNLVIMKGWVKELIEKFQKQ